MPEKDQSGAGEPNSIYLSLGFQQLMHRAVWAARRIRQGHYSAVDTILYSAMAAEAFPNDFALMANTFLNQDEKVPEIVTAAQILPELEEQRVQTKTKFQILYYILQKRPFPVGDTLWQDFNLLIELRNSIAHVKPETVTWSNTGRKGAKRSEKLIAALRSRKLISRPLGAEPYDWHFVLEDDDIAPRWALNTTKSLVQFIANAMPSSFLRRAYTDSFFRPDSVLNDDWPA